MSFPGTGDPNSRTATEIVLGELFTKREILARVRKLINDPFSPPELQGMKQREAFEVIASEIDPVAIGISREHTKYIDWVTVFAVLSHYVPRAERACDHSWKKPVEQCQACRMTNDGEGWK